MKYNWAEMTDEQKMAAVKEEMSLGTHNGTTKDDFIEIMRFLAGRIELIDKALEPEPLTVEQLRQMDGEPVWTGRRWGVVRSSTPRRPDMPAIHFNYGWEWADDVLGCGNIYRTKPM